MKVKEQIGDFIQRYDRPPTEAGQFNVYRVDEVFQDRALPYNRRDFYKIALVRQGIGVLSYADRVIPIDQSVLAFFNPMIPYAWEAVTYPQIGYFCLFTEEFIQPTPRSQALAESDLFRPGGHPLFFPDATTVERLASVFDQMLQEIKADYTHKFELIRNYVQIILHEALKLERPQRPYQPGTSLQRISDLFLKLLEKQFPVPSPQYILPFKTPSDFARQLSIHPNHLNKALKEITGRTTTAWIADKISQEAKLLLTYSDWNIAQIGYSLGFEHAANFTLFFKKQTGQSPNQFRKQGALSA